MTEAVKSYWYLSSHGIIVSGSGEGATQLADLSSGFVNGDNISERGAQRKKETDYVKYRCLTGLSVPDYGCTRLVS